MSEAGELTARLVEIDSVNPTLISGAAGEAEIATFVASWLRDRGLELQIVEAAPGRPSVIATARGRGGGRSLLLNGHLDTVGVAAMPRPFEARIEDGRLYGRGAYDMKGGLAATMLAAADAATLGLVGDVIVTAVADEEVASIGTAAVLEHVTADAAVVAEPTDGRVAVAHRGFVGFEVEVSGVAAHGSRPDLGVDAIAKIGPILAGLGDLGRQLHAGRRHPLVGTASVHAALIEGGQELSSYPERCLLTAERRTLPGETLSDVLAEVESLLSRARSGDDSLRVEARALVERDAYELDPEHELARAMLAAAGEAEVGGVAFWADSALIAAAGIPTVLLGPAGEGAHAAVEWVDLASVEHCRQAYVALATAWCA